MQDESPMFWHRQHLRDDLQVLTHLSTVMLFLFHLSHQTATHHQIHSLNISLQDHDKDCSSNRDTKQTQQTDVVQATVPMQAHYRNDAAPAKTMFQFPATTGRH